MRYLLMALVALSSTCGPPPVTNLNCCVPTPITRGFGFTGSYALDGGSTEVQLIVRADGVTTLSFVRGNDVVIETFQPEP